VRNGCTRKEKETRLLRWGGADDPRLSVAQASQNLSVALSPKKPETESDGVSSQKANVNHTLSHSVMV
jgi:hypothetical protein